MNGAAILLRSGVEAVTNADPAPVCKSPAVWQGGFMARISLVPQNREFFRLLERASDNAVGISRQLIRLLDQFPSDGSGVLREIKELEHAGDRLTREVVDLLNGTFG